MTRFFYIGLICVLPIDLIFLCGRGTVLFFVSFFNGIESMVARASVPSPSDERGDDDRNVIRQFNVWPLNCLAFSMSARKKGLDPFVPNQNQFKFNFRD